MIKVFGNIVAIPPGETIKELLSIKRISQVELAKRMGYDKKTVNEIINGKGSLTRNTAILLSNILGLSVQSWLNLEAAYNSKLAMIEMEKKAEEEKEMINNFPYNDISNEFGLVKKTRDTKEKVKELWKFFGVPSLREISNNPIYEADFRRQKQGDDLSTLAWLNIGRLLCEKKDTDNFNKRRLKSKIKKFRELTLKKPEFFLKELQRICSECGVILIIIPHLKGTYSHGAAQWLSKSRVLIQMSLRRIDADVFWFSFFHELGHVLLHERKITICSEDEEKNIQREADEFAKNTLIPKESFELFIQEDITVESVKSFAEKIRVHPGIVVGRLQHEELLSFKNKDFNDLKQKITDYPDYC